MRIGIDVRYLSHGLVGGVHTYIAQFVPELIDLAPNHQVYLYADTKRPFELGDLPGHVTVRFLPWVSSLSSVYYDLTMWREIDRDRLDVMHYPANYGFAPRGTRTVITLHDAMNIFPLREIWRGLADGYPRRTPRLVAMTTYLHFCTRAAVGRADLLLTDSQHAARDIIRHSGLDSRKVVPIPLALAPDARRVVDPSALDDVRRRHGVLRPFVLADALKNPAAVVQAWRSLPAELRDERQILFFSRRPNPLPIVHEAVAEGHALLLVNPSRPDLIALYSTADAFVFPSWIEGFGIPVLEAMTCGAPVIASNRGSIPEVVGDAALLADPNDVAAFARHLATLLGEPEEARRLRERGLARATEFSWRRNAERILECYESVAQPGRQDAGLNPLRSRA